MDIIKLKTLPLTILLTQQCNEIRVRDLILCEIAGEIMTVSNIFLKGSRLVQPITS